MGDDLKYAQQAKGISMLSRKILNIPGRAGTIALGICVGFLPTAAIAQQGVTDPSAASQDDITRHISTDGSKPHIQIFEGTGQFVSRGSSQNDQGANKSGDITLDFSDADVHDVVRSVLGDTLNVSFVIDPQVTGKITLKTGNPITKDAVIPALEAALRMNGDAIILSHGAYSIVPLASAQKQSQISVSSARSGAPGFGVEIIPLKFTSAEEMQRILEPLAPGSILRVDAQRGLIFIAGTEPERESVKDTISLFDADYLKGMSFALVQPAHVDVGTLATELGKIFDQASSPVAGLVRMIPISRINTLLVITSRASYLHDVSNWVNRLDVASVSPGRQIHYYRLQNARAKDVAETLNQLFGNSGSSASSSQSATNGGANQLAPASTNSIRASLNAADTSNMQPVPQTGDLASGNFGDAEGPQIVTDDSNNALLIRADPVDYASIEQVIGKMDVVPDQVLIEVTIAEVTLNDELKYGVEWYFKKGGATFAQSPTGSVVEHFPGFGLGYTVANVNVALSALGTLTQISIVSSPKLLTLDNKTASLEVGDQVPIVTQTASSTNAPDAPLVSTVQQRDTGVILSVTPRIGHSGMVFLDVSQEVSEGVPTKSSGIDSPTIQERKLQTTVGIQDGTTVALGGLIRRADTKGNSGIPYLKDIPVLGTLFGAANDTRDRTELLVFLTPHVIRSTAESSSVTNGLSKQLDEIGKAIDYFDRHKHDIPRGVLN